MDTRAPATRATLALAAIMLACAAAAACSQREAAPTATATPPAATATPTPMPRTPAPTATPEATRTPAIDGVELRDLVDGPLTRLDAYAVIVEMGCWGCDGPPTGLVRYYETPEGSFRQDALFRGPVDPTRYITGIAFRRGTQEMAVSVCTAGYCGHDAEPTADATVTLFQSTDGGVTWEPAGQYPGAVTVVGFAQDDWLLARYLPGEAAPASVFLAGSGITFEAPPNAHGRMPPHIVGGGTPLWVSDDGRALLRDDGTVFFEVPLDGAAIAEVAALSDLEGLVAVSWSRPDGSGVARGSYLTIIDAGTPQVHLRLDGQLLPGDWADGHRIIGNIWGRSGADSEPLPVIIDLRDATIRPLDGPFGSGHGGSSLGDLTGRNFVRAAIAGPFARVLGPACTEVVDEPGGTVLGCFAPGVILPHEGSLRSDGGRAWLRVQTPVGGRGWAPTEFLEW